MSKAAIYRHPGDASVIEWIDVPDPVPGPWDVLIEVKAFGINRADIVQREGKYPPPAGVTDIPGLEASGVVLACGKRVTRFVPGDRVMTLVPGGAYAALLKADSRTTWKIPDPVPFTVAAALPEMLMTAWMNLVTIGKLKRGETILIHAGASGIGMAAIQLAVWCGAMVAVTCGTTGKQTFCQSLGASLAINYRETPSFSSVIKQQMKGVHLILDPVGASYLTENISCLLPDGRLILIGLMGEAVADKVNLGQILVKRLRITGSTLRNLPILKKAAVARDLEKRVLPWVYSGAFHCHIDRVFRPEELPDAHRLMESNQTMGKLVVLF